MKDHRATGMGICATKKSRANLSMSNIGPQGACYNERVRGDSDTLSGGLPMKADQWVNIHLTEPSERFWGRLLMLSDAGATLRCIDVKQIEPFKYQFKSDRQIVFPQTIFFPMRRIQQIDLDEAMGDLPSTIEAVLQITGLAEDRLFCVVGTPGDLERHGE